MYDTKVQIKNSTGLSNTMYDATLLYLAMRWQIYAVSNELQILANHVKVQNAVVSDPIRKHKTANCIVLPFLFLSFIFSTFICSGSETSHPAAEGDFCL